MWSKSQIFPAQCIKATLLLNITIKLYYTENGAMLYIL